MDMGNYLNRFVASRLFFRLCLLAQTNSPSKTREVESQSFETGLRKATAVIKSIASAYVHLLLCSFKCFVRVVVYALARFLFPRPPQSGSHVK